MKFLNGQNNHLWRASAMLAVFGLLSRLIGLVRDRILATRFGASDILDVYYISFNIPDFIFNLLVVGAVSSAFIPVFIQRQSEDKEGAWRLASNFLNILGIFVIGVSIILFFLTPFLIKWIAPGFSLEKSDLAVLFTQVMLASPIIFTISIIIGSILQSLNKFLAYALAPIMYNLGIIFGAVFLEPRFGPLGLAEGVVLGALFHLLIQMPSVKNSGFRWQAAFDFTQAEMRNIFRLMIPRTIGLVAMQVNWIILNAIATTISVGSVVIFNFANNLQYVPIAFIGLSVAVASFPGLSRQALKDRLGFTRQIDKTLHQILFIIVPLSVLFIYLREDIVRVVLAAGNFRADEVMLTADVLGLFGAGIFAQSIIPFLSRSFYAMQNTKIPVFSALISVAINITLVLWFADQISNRVLALPLAFSVAGIINAVLLLIYLDKNLPEFSFWKILSYFGKISLLSFLMFLVIYFLDYNFIHSWFSQTFLGSFFHGLIISGLGLLTVLFIASMLKINESRNLKIWR